MSALIIGNSTVKFNQEAGEWQVRQGNKVATFGQLKEGMYDALRFAITLEYPEVVALIAALEKKYVADPHLDDLIIRAWRAARLLVTGYVLAPFKDDGRTVARVCSLSRRGQYYVHAYGGGIVSCNCPDYNNGAPIIREGQRACKHILAVLFARRLDWELFRDDPRAGRRAHEAYLVHRAVQKSEKAYQESALGRYHAELARVANGGQAWNEMMHRARDVEVEEGF